MLTAEERLVWGARGILVAGPSSSVILGSGMYGYGGCCYRQVSFPIIIKRIVPLPVLLRQARAKSAIQRVAHDDDAYQGISMQCTLNARAQQLPTPGPWDADFQNCPQKLNPDTPIPLGPRPTGPGTTSSLGPWFRLAERERGPASAAGK